MVHSFPTRRSSDPHAALLVLHADLEMLVNVGGRERTTDEYAALLARSGLRLTKTIALGTAPEAMGHQLVEAQPEADASPTHQAKNSRRSEREEPPK